MDFNTILKLTKEVLNENNINFNEVIFPIFDEYISIRFLNAELLFYCSTIKKINEKYGSAYLYKQILNKIIYFINNNKFDYIKVDLYECSIHTWVNNSKDRHKIILFDYLK